jgi:hypothetical protein
MFELVRGARPIAPETLGGLRYLAQIVKCLYFLIEE